MKTIILLILAASPCWARIGETKEQCSARYGALIEEQAGRKLVFNKGGLWITCFLKEGKVWALGISLAPNAATTLDDSFSREQILNDAQVQAVLKANSNGKPWKLIKREEGLPGGWYETEDGSIRAAVNTVSLWIETRERADALTKALQKEEINKALQGF